MPCCRCAHRPAPPAHAPSPSPFSLSQGKSFEAYAARFAMPAPASGVDTVWYSLDIAGVHWVTLSNYHPFTSGSEQYNWLKADLAAVDKAVTPWIFVNTHAPYYNTNTAHQGDGEAQRKALESMLFDAGVDGESSRRRAQAHGAS